MPGINTDVVASLYKFEKARLSFCRILGFTMLFITISGCSVFGVRSAEEAVYTLLVKEGDFELRLYDSLVTAETVVNANFDKAGDQAFNRLFKYISGDNQNGTSIAMTAPVMATQSRGKDTDNSATGDESTQLGNVISPVIAQKNGQGWKFSFVLPSDFSLDNAPDPLATDVSLKRYVDKKVAVLQFSGLLEEGLIRQKSIRLQEWVEQRNLQTTSPHRVAGYDPPWTLPMFRRNEIMVDITE